MSVFPHLLFFKKKVFFYLAAPGLSCGKQGLFLKLQHMGSLVVPCELIVAACGI